MVCTGLLLMGILTNRRRVKTFPYDAEVEYLESDGNQFIQIDYSVTGYDNVCEVSFNVLEYIENTPYRGATFTNIVPDDSYNCYRIIRNNLTNNFYVQFGNIAGSNIPGALNTKFVAKLENRAITLNGIRYSLSANRGKEFNGELNLFREGVRTQIYFFKWIKGNDVIFDLIPVRKDGKGYMYDRVSGKLFGSMTDNDFIVGPDI